VSVENTKLARRALKPDVSLSAAKKRAEAEKKDPKTHAEVIRKSTLYVSEQQMGRAIPYAHLIARCRPLV